MRFDGPLFLDSTILFMSESKMATIIAAEEHFPALLALFGCRLIAEDAFPFYCIRFLDPSFTFFNFFSTNGGIADAKIR